MQNRTLDPSRHAPLSLGAFLDWATALSAAAALCGGLAGCAADSARDTSDAQANAPARDADPSAPVLNFDASGGTPTGAGGASGGAASGGTGGADTDADAPTADAMVTLPDAAPPRPVTQCSNGLDDDADGLWDAADGDCSSDSDPTEQGDHAPVACGNAVDDDGDGVVDFPDEPGCVAAGDNDEADPADAPQCSDGQDNNGDGQTDFPADPGCLGRGTLTETTPASPPACADGEDNDGDGATDFPDDQECTGAAAFTEESPGGCGSTHHVVDLNRALGVAEFVEGDTATGGIGFVGTCGGNAGPEVVFSYRIAEVVGALEFTTEFPETAVPTVLYVRAACDDPRDLGCNRGSEETPGTHVRIERPAVGTYFVVVDTSMADQSGVFRLGAHVVDAPRCSDARDNDLDGRTDLADPGCENEADEDEADPPMLPECGDGLDNDADGQIDFPADPTCHAAGGRQETDASCALAPNLILMDAAGGMIHVSSAALPSAYTSTCGGNAEGPEQVIAVVVDHAARISVQTVNNGFDTVLHARSACDDPATQYACDDDGAGGLASSIGFATPGPGVSYIFVDGFAGRGGETDVVVTVQ